MKIGSGGSVVGSAQITDGAIVNADINAAAAIAQSKVAGSSNGNTDVVAAEITAGTTHSLTTVAGQRVLVIAKGYLTGAVNSVTVSLLYNGVTKDSNLCPTTTNGEGNFCLVYTEVPGAATANITVTVSGGASNNVKIMVLKLK